MCDQAKMSQTALDARVQDGTGPRVSQRSSVLSEEVCEFLTDLPARHKASVLYTTVQICAKANKTTKIPSTIWPYVGTEFQKLITAR